MKTGLNNAAAVSLALLVSCAGLLLFRISGREIKTQLEEETEILSIGFMAMIPQKLWKTGMFAGNLLLAAVWTVFEEPAFLMELRIQILCTVLWVCAWTDCKAYLILNKVLLIAVLVFIGLLAAEAVLAPENIRYTVMASGVPAAGLLLAGMLCRIVVPKSIGFGDLKLFIVIGLYLGVYTWNAVFYTLLASFLVSAALLAAKRASKKTVMPFAPFLLFGTLLAAFFCGE